jgi:hypothetical protein
MGRNAAFSRAPALDRLRAWWEAQDPASRTNVLLALGVGALVLGIVIAALARDTGPATPAANVTRPPMQPPVFGTPSTVVIDGLNAPATSTSSSSSTTTSTPAVTTTATSQPATTTSPTVATTAPPAPATTVTNPGVVFTEPPTTTVSTVATTLPPSTLPSTTVAPATTTTTSGLTLPLDVPRLLGP